MKLISITFGSTPKLPGLRPTDLGTIKLDNPGEALRGWRLFLRGSTAFFVSPPGWVPDQSEKKRDPKGAVTIHEVARDELRMQWSVGADKIEDALKNNQWESPPFGWQPAPIASDKPILEQIPASQVGDA